MKHAYIVTERASANALPKRLRVECATHGELAHAILRAGMVPTYINDLGPVLEDRRTKNVISYWRQRR